MRTRPQGAPPARLAIGAFGVGVTLSDASGLGVGARVVSQMPPELVGRVADRAQVEYVINADPDARVTVTRGGAAGCAELEPHEAVRWLCADIDAQVACLADEGVFVHAGVVGWRGRAIVIPGRSGTGKSHVVAELVRRGCVYYSDEFAVIDPEGRVHPYARILPLVETESETTFLEASTRPHPRPPLPLTLIAAVAYRSGVSWAPTVRTGARAVLALIDNTIVGQAEPERALAMARTVAPDVVAVCGPRPEASDVAQDLIARVDAIVDGTATADPTVWDDRLAVVEQARHRPNGDEADQGGTRARYTILPEFLTGEDRARLVELALARENDFQASQVIDPGGHGYEDRESRQSRVLYDLGELGPMFERAIRPFLPYLRKELGMGWFSPEITEVQLAVHEDGSFFKAHRDLTPTQVGWRSLTCVYHFSISHDFDGGELVLYDGVAADGAFVVIPPTDNTLVCFPSETFHEVRPVHRTNDDFAGNRFAVSIWFWDSGFRPWRSSANPAAGALEVTGRVG